MKHSKYPSVFYTGSNRFNACINEFLADSFEIIPCGWYFDTLFFEHFFVVPHYGYRCTSYGTIQFAIVDIVGKSGFTDFLFVIFVIIIQAHYFSGRYERFGKSTRPGKENVRKFIGSDGRFDLRFIGFIFKCFHINLYTGMIFLKLLDCLKIRFVERVAFCGDRPHGQGCLIP